MQTFVKGAIAGNMSLRYHVDGFQVFRRCVVVEGWAFRIGEEALPDLALVCGDRVAHGEIERLVRPDVRIAEPQAPTMCGFILRVIVPASTEVTMMALRIDDAHGGITVERPWEHAYAQAADPLGAINEKFFGAVRNHRAGGRALELGARARSGIVRREMFGDAIDYTGLDIKEGDNVDIVGDAHLLSSYFAEETFDFAYSNSVFEHLMWPWKVAIELGRVLKLDGLILMQSHPVWPKHDMPWDFFRFWDSGWRALFCEATGFEVIETIEAHPVHLVASPFSGNYIHYWDRHIAFLSSAVLARKIAMPTADWTAAPSLDIIGSYPG